jgi:hypothetical protein
MRKKYAALLCVAAVAAAGHATAASPGLRVKSDGVSLRFEGLVPVICRASIGSTTVHPIRATMALGQISEFCNSPRGYRVVMEHSPALKGARLLVDNAQVPLSTSGSTVVSESHRPGAVQRTLGLSLPAGAAPGTLNFRIVPL